MSDLADVFVLPRRREGNVLGQMEVPVLSEAQVGLDGVDDLLSVLEQLDGDVRGVELTDVADQHVLLFELCRSVAVYLDHWGF